MTFHARKRRCADGGHIKVSKKGSLRLAKVSGTKRRGGKKKKHREKRKYDMTTR